MFNKKGQLSIEVLIILIFLITFIYVYNSLAEQTVYTLEINKIKEQQQTIGLSLNEFLEIQKDMLYDVNIIDYNSSYTLQELKIPSKRIFCYVDFNLSNAYLTVHSDYSNVHTIINTTITNTEFTLPERINCGEIVVCELQSNKIVCT